MELTTKVNDLRDVVRGIKEVNKESNMVIYEDRVEFIVTDPAMVGLAEVTLKDDFFSEFSVGEDELSHPEKPNGEPDEEKEKRVRHSVPVDDLDSILRKLGKKDDVTLRAEPDDAHIRVTRGRSTFKLGLISNLDMDEINTSMNFAYEADFNTAELFDTFDTAAVLSDSTRILNEETDIVMEGSGNTGESRDAISPIEESDIVEGDVNSMFSNDYLAYMLKSLKRVGDRTRVYLGEDFPARFTAERDGVTFTFLVAPRIEED